MQSSWSNAGTLVRMNDGAMTRRPAGRSIGPARPQRMVGITKSAPARIPVGQRVVMVLSLV